MKDLRSFLVDAEAQLTRARDITTQVSPVRELAAIVRLLEGLGSPIVFFHAVADHELPVITGVHGTRERIALALGTEVRSTTDAFPRRLGEPLAPVVADDAPVKDVVITGEDVDLARLPIPVHATKDGGAVLTCAVGVVRDGASGQINTGIYRMQVLDRNHVSVCAAPISAPSSRTPSARVRRWRWRSSSVTIRPSRSLRRRRSHGPSTRSRSPGRCWPSRSRWSRVKRSICPVPAQPRSFSRAASFRAHARPMGRSVSLPATTSPGGVTSWRSRRSRAVLTRCTSTSTTCTASTRACRASPRARPSCSASCAPRTRTCAA